MRFPLSLAEGSGLQVVTLDPYFYGAPETGKSFAAQVALDCMSVKGRAPVTR